MIDIDSEVPPEIARANESIAREVAECLNKNYPNHAWAVRANIETGLCQVYNLRLSGNWGFVLHLDDLASDPSMKLTIRAGGELLERYNISRAKLKEGEYEDVKYDFTGQGIQS